MFTSSATTFVHHFNGGNCNADAMTQKQNYEFIQAGAGISEADCRARCEADTECDFYQTLNHLAYSSGWAPHCQLYRNAYCDPEKLTTNHAWFQVHIKASGIPPVETVTSGAPMTASCSSQPLDYCLKLTWEGGNSPYAPGATVWRLADVQNGEPVFVKDEKETDSNGALGFHPNFNKGDLLANYCAGQTWGAVVLDKFPEYSFIVGGTFNWGIAGSCTGTETADILEVFRGQRDSITTAFRARTNSYGPAHRDVKIEVVRDVMECGGRFYSDALFSKTESEQCAIMEAVLPKKSDVWECTLQAYCQGNWELADGTGDYQSRNTKGIDGVDVNGDGKFDWDDKATDDFWATESWPVPDACKALCLPENGCHGVTWHGNPYFGTSQCVTCTGSDQSLNDPSVNPHSRWQYCKRPAATGTASSSPTKEPTKNPTLTPTANPTKQPTKDPSANPTKEPSNNPTVNPTRMPTASPSFSPTKEPSMNPTLNPTANPSPFPTAADFIIKIKAFHGKPSDILDSDKVQAQPDVDVDLYSFEQKLTPINGDRRLLNSDQQ